MKRLRAALVLSSVLALGCAGSERPSGSTTATLFGPDWGLETWKTSVVEGVHVHALEPDQPCIAVGMGENPSTSSEALPERRLDMKQMSAKLDAVMESMLATSSGPAHGGPGRTVLALRRPDRNESLIVDLPRLESGEREGLFRAGDLKAVYSRSPLVPAARLERGWVRAKRADSGRIEYDLFLVLRMLAPDAPVATLQVITRVVWPPPGPR
jgi:hypothetical protein